MLSLTPATGLTTSAEAEAASRAMRTVAWALGQELGPRKRARLAAALGEWAETVERDAVVTPLRPDNVVSIHSRNPACVAEIAKRRDVGRLSAALLEIVAEHLRTF